MRMLLTTLFALFAVAGPQAEQRRPLSDAHIADLAVMLKLEDMREYDEAALSRLLSSSHPEVKRRAVMAVARIADARGSSLLAPFRTDADAEIVATVAFAYGQLKDADAVAWLDDTLSSPGTPPAVAREAARALGKIRTPEAWTALERFLLAAPAGDATAPVVGEALFSFGRFTEGRDVAPAVRWITSANDEVRWRAAWALFRPRNPAALPHLLTLSADPSAEVRFWAVRGLAAEVVDRAEIAGVTRAITSARLRAAVTDSDRRVRTEAIRALGGYDDDESVKMLRAAEDDPDSWMSVSAAEGVASVEARSAAAAAAAEEGAQAGRGGRQGGRGQGAGRGGRQGGGGQRPADVREPRPDADYRRLVLDWIVPAYNGAPNPRAVWTTPKGEIELELYPGEAPFGTEEFLRLTESGAIVGTVFSRVVPNFVAQQATITGANRLRDEVTRLGLTRGNLAWASGGLDTGRPGYTLGSTPQPHNEGDFTTLGRVVRGMDVVDRLEQGDAVTAARMVR